MLGFCLGVAGEDAFFELLKLVFSLIPIPLDLRLEWIRVDSSGFDVVSRPPPPRVGSTAAPLSHLKRRRKQERKRAREEESKRGREQERRGENRVSMG